MDVDQLPGFTVQSWDTASKDGVMNDWSVCVTARCHKGQIHVLDVFRQRLTINGLQEHAIRLAREYRARELLIEDAASGIQLAQLLRRDEPSGVPWPISCKPEADKKSRMAGAAARIEAGQLILPEEAHWLASFKSELLAFPSGRFDDQADALSQLINWHTRCNDDYDYTSLMAGPELIDLDTPYRESSWDEQLSAWFGD